MIARGLKFRIKEVEGSVPLFSHMQKAGFLMMQLF